ncbi:hypothetical protein [Nitrosococcus oceani]|uniref:hypothetical protein n=1 Tax=Nitrosococcus oceani TaxID=1229 RepID=UPI0012E05383|nr:hypothetical protein [Nitrosococcus oceani]
MSTAKVDPAIVPHERGALFQCLRKLDINLIEQLVGDHHILLCNIRPDLDQVVLRLRCQDFPDL